MTRVVHLVDSTDYAETNCYQHQLTIALRAVKSDIQTLPLVSMLHQKCEADAVVSCLKQRTVARYARELKAFLGEIPWVMYDQDPWEALKDDSPLKGTYEKVSDSNLKALAVTTHHFADILKNKGLPGTFVKMGMLPKYCDPGPSFETRSHKVAFIGTLHPRRQRLFEELRKLRVPVVAQPNTLGYHAYLTALHDVGVFVHNEDAPLVIDGKPDNMGKGMWIKDVEAAARGCYSVRNNEAGHDTYCADIPTIKVFNNPVEAAETIKMILSLDSQVRQAEIDHSVATIKHQDSWNATARQLIELTLQRM